MTTQLTSNWRFNHISSFFVKQMAGSFGKALVLSFFLTIMSAVSYAQSGNLYEVRSNYRLGTITSYQTTWRIDMGNNQEIKIYNCSAIPNSGIKCVFTQFKDGRTTHSGEAQIYQSGAVYLRWVYEFNGNQQRQVNGGWIAYQVR